MHWRKLLKFIAILFLPNFLLGVFFGYFLLDNLYEPISYYLLQQILGSFIIAFVVCVFVKDLPNNHLINVLVATSANYLLSLCVLVYLIGLEYFSSMVLFEFILYISSVAVGFAIASRSKKGDLSTTV